MCIRDSENRKYPSLNFSGSKGFEGTLNWETFERPFLGQLNMWLPSPDIEEREASVEMISELVRLVNCPFGFVSALDGAQSASGFSRRRKSHRVIFQRGKAKGDGQFGICRGLSGVPWRMVLGPALIDFFGEQDLASLPADLAQKQDNGTWLLTPCENPQDWTADTWCPGEEAIINPVSYTHLRAHETLR